VIRETFAKRIQRAGADVAKHDSQSSERQFPLSRFFLTSAVTHSDPCENTRGCGFTICVPIGEYKISHIRCADPRES
jgi:hypothetical protein